MMSPAVAESPERSPSKLDQPYRVRGYIRRLRNGKYLGVCLTLHLVVEAETQAAARAKLEDLIDAYVDDAIENDEVDAFIPRRAPLSFYGEYWRLRLQSLLHRIGDPFTILNEVRTL